MFSTKLHLEQKTGPYGIGRFSYLQSLVTEYQDTDSEEAKEQVLANLANFAYDPINYEHFRKLNILDLFLDTLEDSNEKLVEFAIGGLCNVCLDRENKEHILKHDGINLVTRCLSRTSEETVLSAITTLMYLVTPRSKDAVTNVPVVECMLRFSQSSNPRLSNLANIFLQDYCSAKKIEEARHLQQKLVTQTSPS